MYVVTTHIAGLYIRWESDLDKDIDCLSDLLRHHVIAEAEADHTVRFNHVWDDFTPPPEARLKCIGSYIGRFKEEAEVKRLEDPTRGVDYFVLNPEIWFLHRPADRLTEVFHRCHLNECGEKQSPPVNEAILLLIHSTLSLYDRYTIHSAGVALNGEAFLFLGESGHGKSTLCTDLVRLGAAFMGDDILFLYEENGRLTVGSLLFHAKLFPRFSRRYKRSIDVIEELGSERVYSAPLRRLFYLTRSGKGDSVVTPLDPMDAMTRLLHAGNNVAMQFHPRTWTALAARTAEEVPYHSFVFGDRKRLRLEDLLIDL